jgi:hypothetical protein
MTTKQLIENKADKEAEFQSLIQRNEGKTEISKEDKELKGL